jgi:hypothetical protein
MLKIYLDADGISFESSAMHFIKSIFCVTRILIFYKRISNFFFLLVFNILDKKCIGCFRLIRTIWRGMFWVPEYRNEQVFRIFLEYMSS